METRFDLQKISFSQLLQFHKNHLSRPFVSIHVCCESNRVSKNPVQVILAKTISSWKQTQIGPYSPQA